MNGLNGQTQPDPNADNTRAAIEALKKLTRNVQQGTIVDPLDTMVPGSDETPTEAKFRMYGQPEGFRKDIQLKPEEDDSGLRRWIRLARQGLLFGVKEAPAETEGTFIGPTGGGY